MAAVDEKQLDWQQSLFAPLPETNRGYCLQLDGHKKARQMLYANGRHVVIRSLEDHNIAEIFSEHKFKVNVARFSPNGEWVASGDERGKVLIWALNSKKIKLEVQACRKVMDLAWSEDGMKIVAVGDGNESMGKVFTWDSGNNVGEIAGHAKMLITCAFKTTRPFRIITGSEDNAVILHEGPPFKLKTLARDHTRYPNCVRFSPDGTKAISVGADRQIIVWDAKEGTKINEIGLVNAAQNHTMSILSFSWSPDSKQILTSSMDGSAKLWNVESGSVVHTWKFGAEKEIAHQQVGTLWVDQWVLSVGLNGMIHHLDIETGNVIKTVHGHQGNITGLAVSEGRIWTSDTQGTLLNVNGKTHVQYTGDGHNKGCVVSLARNSTNSVIHTIGLDNSLRSSSCDNSEFGAAGSAAALGGQPTKLATANTSNTCCVALATRRLVVVRDGAVVQTLPTGDYDVKSLCYSPSDNQLAVGCTDRVVRLFAVDAAGQLTLDGEITNHDAAVTAITYSPNGARMVTAGEDRFIYFWDTTTRKLQNDGWQFHTGGITSVAFTASGDKLITGSIDQSLIVWHDLTNKNKYTQLQFAHIGGVDAICVLNDTQFVTSGADRTIRTWQIKA